MHGKIISNLHFDEEIQSTLFIYTIIIAITKELPNCFILIKKLDLQTKQKIQVVMNFLCRLNDRGRTEYGKEKTDNFTLLLCPHFIDLLKIRFSSNSISNYLLNKKPELKSGDFLVHGINVCENKDNPLQSCVVVKTMRPKD